MCTGKRLQPPLYAPLRSSQKLSDVEYDDPPLSPLVEYDELLSLLLLLFELEEEDDDDRWRSASSFE